MKHYLIYQIRNKLNGMIYVGQHQTENVDDGYMGSGLRIRRAIEKYGLENFEKTILFECASVEEMNAKEAEIVDEDFIARDDVYNIKLGGDGGWNEVNKNPANVGINHFFKNKTDEEIKYLRLKGAHSNKARVENMTASEYQQFKEFHSHLAIKWHQEHIGYFAGKNNPMYGKHHSKETRMQMSKKKQGKNNSQYGKMWICNDETHESRSILKTDLIPPGWRKGRFCKRCK